MKAELISVHRFLSMPDGVFIIPIYQRNYAWEAPQCKQLWNDIMEVATGQQPNHFIGSICVQDDAKIRRGTVIIDGQQRVTTLMLLFRALMDSTDDDRLRSIITHNYLINMNAIDDQTRLRLKPVARDEGAFRKLMDVGTEIVPEAFSDEEQAGNAYRNYWLFRSLVSQATKTGAVTLEEIEQVVEDLEVIEIRLQDENAQVVFESLNSTGIPLEQADLVRNFILMALPYGEQERLYMRYWKPLEDAVGLDRLQDFMLNWLVMRRQSDSFSRNGKAGKLTKKTVYEGYRHFFADICSQLGEDGTEDGLADMLRYARIYGRIMGLCKSRVAPSSKSERLCREILEGTGAPKATCLVMYLMGREADGDWDERDLEMMLTALSSYCVRRVVCGSRSPIDFQTAANIIRRVDGWNAESDMPAAAMFWIAVTSGLGSYAFPSTTSFREGLRRVDMYTLRGNFAKDLLYAMESAGPNAKEIPANDRNITVEHIMPQTLSEEWTAYLEERDDIDNYESHLHMLGNLCLTGYNSELSNKMFDEKKPIYAESGFAYTKHVTAVDEWTSVQIEQRTSSLAKVACRLWPLPATYDNGNRAVPGQWYPLDTDPFAFRGLKPAAVDFQGTRTNVGSWVDLLIQFVATCHQVDDSVLAQEAKIQSTMTNPWLGLVPDALHMPRAVPGTQYFVSTGVSSTVLLSRTQELADFFQQAIGIDMRNEFLITAKIPASRRRG